MYLNSIVTDQTSLRRVDIMPTLINILHIFDCDWKSVKNADNLQVDDVYSLSNYLLMTDLYLL